MLFSHINGTVSVKLKSLLFWANILQCRHPIKQIYGHVVNMLCYHEQWSANGWHLTALITTINPGNYCPGTPSNLLSPDGSTSWIMLALAVDGINPLFVGAVLVRNTDLIINLAADGMTPALAILWHQQPWLWLQSSFNVPLDIGNLVNLLDKMTSFKMATEIPSNLAAFRVLKIIYFTFDGFDEFNHIMVT